MSSVDSIVYNYVLFLHLEYYCSYSVTMLDK